MELIKTYGSKEWEKNLKTYLNNYQSLVNIYENKRQLSKVPIKINNKTFNFSFGKHNELQKAIIEEFAPRFAPNSTVLYIGDSKQKSLYKHEELLNKLKIEVNECKKIPDIILYNKEKKIIYFIEAVSSTGPFSPKRVLEISQIVKSNDCKKVFITAFSNIKTYKKYIEELAWETQVWISSQPNHMIHYLKK